MYNLNYKLRFGVSLDGVYDGSANVYTEDALVEYDAGSGSSRRKFLVPGIQNQLALGLSGRAEYVMPFFTIGVGLGTNVLGRGDLRGLYQVFALKINVTRSSFLHIGYNLQDFQTPNYLMLGLGFRFNNKYPKVRHYPPIRHYPQMENIIRKIRQIYPVSDEALQALQANMELRYYPKDTRIVQAGVTDRLVYFIEEGIARSVFHHNGEDTTTWFSQEGDVTFGMDSLYYQQPSVESVETLSDCKIYVIHIDKLNALYETYIDIANWGRILHQNVNKELSHMFVERLQLSPKERYEQFNRRYPGLINRVKLKYVAAFLGISIYTLSRVRAKK